MKVKAGVSELVITGERTHTMSFEWQAGEKSTDDRTEEECRHVLDSSLRIASKTNQLAQVTAEELHQQTGIRK